MFLLFFSPLPGGDSPLVLKGVANPRCRRLIWMIPDWKKSFNNSLTRPWRPDDSTKWPFDPLVEGHLTYLKGHVNSPFQKGHDRRIARGGRVFLPTFLDEAVHEAKTVKKRRRCFPLHLAVRNNNAGFLSKCWKAQKLGNFRKVQKAPKLMSFGKEQFHRVALPVDAYSLTWEYFIWSLSIVIRW